jgi:hypothetical protein
MNYTGNPRHLRGRSRSSQKEYLRRQRLSTPAISERPPLDICHKFQERTSQTASATQSVASGDHDNDNNNNDDNDNDNDTFDAKRRRLLLQQDWLGLNVSAPIKVLQ